MAASGPFYLVSGLASPLTGLILVVAARLLHGLAESFLVTGALAWGLARAGSANAGRVMVWVGVAMYGAYAVGAPVGMIFYGRCGPTGMAVAVIAASIAAFFLFRRLTQVIPTSDVRTPFYRVIGAVWLPGFGLACCAIGFGTITSFIALQFAARGWPGASWSFTPFGIAFIAARLLFGHLPDRQGGASVACYAALAEALGQAVIWLAPGPAIAYFGVALTGFGYSLAFPAFGVEAVKRAPPESRGAAMGGYVAFLDVALALGGPLCGMGAAQWSIATVYLCGAIVAGLAMILALYLRQRPAIR